MAERLDRRAMVRPPRRFLGFDQLLGDIEEQTVVVLDRVAISPLAEDRDFFSLSQFDVHYIACHVGAMLQADGAADSSHASVVAPNAVRFNEASKCTLRGYWARSSWGVWARQTAVI